MLVFWWLYILYFRYEYTEEGKNIRCNFSYKLTYIFSVLDFPNLNDIDDYSFSLQKILVCDVTSLEYYNLISIIETKDIDGNSAKALNNKIRIKTHFFSEYDSIFVYDPNIN